MASRLVVWGRNARPFKLHHLAHPPAFLPRRQYSIKVTTLDSPPTPKAGIDQDHHYTPSTATTASTASATGSDLPVHQVSAKTRPLPDGTIPDGADTIPAKTSGTPEPENPAALNTEIFHSRRARALGNAPGKIHPVSADAPTEQPPMAGINGPEFTSTSAEVKRETAKVVDEIKTTKSSSSSSTQPFEMKASPVPSSQLGRLFHYGGLAAGMTFGALNESIRRATGSDPTPSSGLVLNPQNIERLVKTLSKMRGAALKLGQMLSLQDSTFLPTPVQLILSRVQNKADYMPSSQRDAVLTANLGPDWRALFTTFSESPMAAASIGQVHAATLASTGEQVVVKIQYPGVATSISSDLNTLSILLKATRLLPKGLYLDKTIANARTELAWECDYKREAAAQTRFASLIASDETAARVFAVPRVIPEASGEQVLTMQYMHGESLASAADTLPQTDRDWIGTNVLRLCLLEIARWKYMQTDPNWSNFLFGHAPPGASGVPTRAGGTEKKIALLDFGASREYDASFVRDYTGVLQAASRGDTATIRELSVRLGYLTGLEGEEMLRAHIASILALAEPFARTAPEVYDFRGQTVTDRVRALIPVMVRERLTPPPEETYSLHRKLSGAFLLCARLGSRVRAREMFEEVVGGGDA
ncbi:hypothetical protein DRE_02964 [Drechslerella stenobrocha 248]|uniref:ABC1 atypical kinase-like domain-containing protein n=1 Tax=Drechslerella stenobrocha 248 TaxID=1043628 RepID=W7HW60_9PEZI|nr:hypothetical protein DRE_02964 [Drechslerella stenobrocha 248]